MSRASQITLYLVIIQASIGFVDAIDMFPNNYVAVPSNNASYTFSDLESYSSAADEQRTAWSELDLAIHWIIDTFVIGLKILFSVIFVLPSLITIFHIETALAVFIQVGIYYVYAVWYTQYKSGKSWGQIREV